MARQGKPAAAQPHGNEQSTPGAARSRRHEAMSAEESRRARQQAREVRRLLNDAKKIAKRAKTELAVLSRKLRQLLDDQAKTAGGARTKAAGRNKRRTAAKRAAPHARSMVLRRSLPVAAPLASR